MAFDINGFNYTRGFIGSSASNNSKTMHFYDSLVDDKATILAPAYFPASFGLPLLIPKINDTIRVSATDGIFDVVITDPLTPSVVELSGSGPTITTQTETITLSGIWAAPVDRDFLFIRKDYGGGYIITDVACPTGVQLPATTAGVISFGSLFPYAPATGATSYVMNALDNAANVEGKLFVTNSFVEMTLFGTTIFSGLSTMGDSGFYPFTFSYLSV